MDSQPSVKNPMPLLKYSYEVALDWCDNHGWTDLFVEQYQYWAFPPGGVMPLPLPPQALEFIDRDRQLTPHQTQLHGIAIGIGLASTLFSYVFQSPLPLVMGFSLCTLTLALQEA